MIRSTGVEWVPEIPIFWHMYTDYMLYRNTADKLALFETFIEPFYTKTCSYFRFEATETVENSVKHIDTLRFCSLVHRPCPSSLSPVSLELFQILFYSSILKMEAASFSEASILSYQTTWRLILWDCDLYK
jgi:hypothetical protein